MEQDMIEKARQGRRDALRGLWDKSEPRQTEDDPQNVFAIADWSFDDGKVVFQGKDRREPKASRQAPGRTYR